jgi:hypothetical protein
LTSGDAPAATETTAELGALREAIGAEETIVVLLSASPDVVAARINSREPDTSSGVHPPSADPESGIFREGT